MDKARGARPRHDGDVRHHCSPVRAAEEEGRELTRNGLDPHLPAYLAIDSAMRASLANETSRRIVLYSEPLDAQRFPIEPRESEIVASIAKKYSGLHIDVVVTVMRPALDFFMRDGEQLWPGARLVFHGLPDPDSELVTTSARSHWNLVNRDDFGGTIDLARRFVAQCSPNPCHRRRLVLGLGTGTAGTASSADRGGRSRGGIPLRLATAGLGNPGCGGAGGYDRPLSHAVS